MQNKYQRTRLLTARAAVVAQLAQQAAYCRAKVNDEFIIAGTPALAFAPDAYLDNNYTPINIKFYETPEKLTKAAARRLDKREARVMLFELYVAQTALEGAATKFIQILVGPAPDNELVIKEYALAEIEKLLGSFRRVSEDIKEIIAKSNL